MEASEILSRDPERMHGALVFAGTRVPVRALLDHLRAGDTLGEFLDGFPSVSREQAVAALDLALGSLLREDDARPA